MDPPPQVLFKKNVETIFLCDCLPGQHFEFFVPTVDSGGAGPHRRPDKIGATNGRVPSGPAPVSDADSVESDGAALPKY
jgi:hypothetical protein